MSEDNIDYDGDRAQDDDIIDHDPVEGEQGLGIAAKAGEEEKSNARSGTMLHRSFIARL